MTIPSRILFVDDEHMILSALRRETRDWMEENGLEFVEAGSVDQALVVIEENPASFLLVVSDLRMPHRTGSELLAGVRERWPLISTILLTGFSEMEEIKACIRSGIMSFIQKPWDGDFLKTEILRGVELSRMKRQREIDRKQMEEDLYWAKKISQTLLQPSGEHPGAIETGIAYRPLAANSCGGDFFRVYPLQDGVAACLGDLQIEGVKGTYWALRVRDEMDRIMAEPDMRVRFDPGHLLERLNDRMGESSMELPGVFMNLSVLCLAPEAGRMSHASAGGDEIILIRDRKATGFHLPSPGLGYRKGIRFETRETSLASGDMLVLASKGTRDATGGNVRIRDLAFGMDNTWPAQSLAEHALAILAHSLPGGFTSDATIMVVRYPRP